MGTKNCKQCGALMDSAEVTCPICGNKTKSKFKAPIVVILIGGLILTTLFGQYKPNKGEKAESLLTPSAGDLQNGEQDRAPDLSDKSGQATFYVNARVLNVRNAPSANAKVIGKVHLGDSVLLYEKSGVWGRISVQSNTYGKHQWVSTTYLTRQVVIAQVSDHKRHLVRALSHSDDYAKHEAVFIRLSQNLIDSGRCDLEDFEKWGGWIRSQNHKPNSVYFTYCGASSLNNRLYVDAKKQIIFK